MLKFKLQLCFQNLILCSLGSHQLYCPFLAWIDEVGLLTVRLADFCLVALYNVAFVLCSVANESHCYRMNRHIYVASTSVLLIFTVISVAVNSNNLLGALLLLKLRGWQDHTGSQHRLQTLP